MKALSIAALLLITIAPASMALNLGRSSARVLPIAATKQRTAPSGQGFWGRIAQAISNGEHYLKSVLWCD